MKTVALGTQGLRVSELGYGCMGLTTFYGTKLPDEDIVNILRKSYDLGINFWDTATLYSFPRESEMVCQQVILAQAIKQIGRENLVIGSKIGLKLEWKPQMKIEPCGDPDFIRQDCEDTLRRLEIDCIDLLYLARIDENIPIEITMATLRDLVEEGKVKYLGLSECSAKTLRRAHKVHPISCVQLEWSLWCRDIEKELVPTCAELGIGIVAYSPLGRGFLGGAIKRMEDISDGDFRKTGGRMVGHALDKNVKFLEILEGIAKQKNATSAQLAISWLMHQQGKVGGAGVVPIPGTTKEKNLISNVEALDISLSDDEIRSLENAVPASEVAGGRYGGQEMQKCWENESNKEMPPEEAAKYYK